MEIEGHLEDQIDNVLLTEEERRSGVAPEDLRRYFAKDGL